SVQAKARNIKLLLLDVDGVLTDGGIYLDDRGVETKRFDVRDGQGITLLQRTGMRVGIITGRSSKVVRYRARELGVTMVYQKVRDKAAIYDKIKRETGLEDRQIAYVGDDIGDLPVLRRAGLAITVRDSWSALESEVDYITKADGGRGAVREVVEWLLRASGAWQRLTKDLSFR
ncbi:MAG: HAD-IIIA family hydrolase, partial [Deltaproteobacteria bacterium]|nr:HAD-IIIA family hydrolase [Deltaproteobacteria bacterium]